MRFALIGDHPDGLALASALVRTNRHEFAAYAGPADGLARLRQEGLAPFATPDVEELLARRQIDLIIVADDLAHRAMVLRRALQSEKHVLAVHPVDLLPDITYEAAVIRQETQKVLLPILPWRLAPALVRLRELVRSNRLGKLQIIEAEFPLPAAAPAARAADRPGVARVGKTQRTKSGIPPEEFVAWDRNPLTFLWDPLRYLAGEVREVAVVAPGAEGLSALDTLTVSGRFEPEVMFQVLLAPRQAQGTGKIMLRCSAGQTELTNLLDHTSGSVLRVQTRLEEASESFAPWSPMDRTVELFESSLAGKPTGVTWQDETRCLELFEAARTSARRRRTIPMQYEEFSEESSFKTIMTTAGCLLLIVVVFIMSVLLALGFPLEPWFLYLLLPALALFLLLQSLRWIVPKAQSERTRSAAEPVEEETRS